MDWLNQYQNTSVPQSPGFTQLQRGQHEAEVVKVMFTPRSKAPFALNQPEIEFTVKILSGPNADALGSLKIFPAQPPKTLPPRDGKPEFTIAAGIAQLKKVFEAYSIPMGNPPTMDDLKAGLRSMKGRGMQVFAKGGSNTVYFNRAIEFAADLEPTEVTDDLMPANPAPVEAAPATPAPVQSAPVPESPPATGESPEEIFELDLD